MTATTELDSLEKYLHSNIPLSKAMAVTVKKISEVGITLSAPLAPNINHRDTVFGGSASALAILSAWALLFVKLRDAGITSRVVIQKNNIHYQKPIVGDFIAVAEAPDALEWSRFIAILKRKKRARICVKARLFCMGEPVGELEGDFVAIGFNNE